MKISLLSLLGFALLTACSSKEDVPQSQLDTMQLSAAMSNSAEGKAFLLENSKRPDVVTLPSGVQYKVLIPSKQRSYSAKLDGASPSCTVMYEGRLINGKVFDASSSPATFSIDGVIQGFSEAIKRMPIGSTWEVYIPAHLAYGAHGPESIGDNATLIFKLQLISIKP